MDIDARRLSARTAVVAGTLGLIAAPVVVILLAPEAFLLLFAGCLLAIFMIGSARIVEEHTPLSYGWSLLATLLMYLTLAALLALLLLPRVAENLTELGEQIPERILQAQDTLSRTSLGRVILREADKALETQRIRNQLDEIWKRSAGALSSAAGALGSGVIILFIGIYLAAMPKAHLQLLRRFLPGNRARKAEETLGEMGSILWRWLMGRLLSMTVVGILIWLGLLLIGLPMALSLGFIAGALSFIPYLGPILALLPVTLVAISESLPMVLWVLGIFFVVQGLESYLLTPLIQKQAVSLHPVAILMAQLVMGSLFGILGVALATPLTAVAMTMAESLAPKPGIGG